MHIKFFAAVAVLIWLGACQETADYHTGSSERALTEIDSVAAAVLDGIQEISFAKNREFCGLLGYNASGQIIATRPVKGGRDYCLPSESEQMVRVIASYHTHGAATRDIDTETPSTEDLIADFSEGINGYVATPGGRLWMIDHRRRAAFLICKSGCVRADPRHKECPAFPPGDYHTQETLNERLYTDPGTC